jgi:hypothetical protein
MKAEAPSISQCTAATIVNSSLKAPNEIVQKGGQVCEAVANWSKREEFSLVKA